MAKTRPLPSPAQQSASGPRRTVSITLVAERAGVSIATVSRVVNGIANKASPRTVGRVRRAVAELDYRPMSAGRALRRRESRLVALLAANLANPTMAAIAASAEVSLRRQGYIMVLCDTHDTPALQDEYLLEMRAQLARATILLGAVRSPQLEQQIADGAQLLFVNRRCPYGRGPFVGIDNLAAGRNIADLFIRRGSERIDVIYGSRASSATADRLKGLRQRMAQAGAALDKSVFVTSPGLDHLDIGYRGMNMLLAGQTRPEQLFCSSDLIAYGAYRRAREASGGVANRLFVVGFDDNPLNDWVAPWLSSIRVPYDRFGEAIVEALCDMAERRDVPNIILPHEIVLRG
jgi:LacI family transcriptional regulator